MDDGFIVFLRQLETQTRNVKAGLKWLTKDPELKGVDDALFTAEMLEKRIVMMINEAITNNTNAHFLNKTKGEDDATTPADDLSFLNDILE